MKKRVMVFGTFDVLHPGHLNFFQQAKKYGQELIVVIARDRTVESVKGRLPLNSEKDRCQLVRQFNLVTKAVLGDLKDQMKAISQYRPHIVCLGYDQQAFVKELQSTFPQLRIVRLKPYRAKYYKSSYWRSVL